MTYRERVAHYFKAHPGQWIDGMELATVGGCYAWRTRLSECRQVLGMDIEHTIRLVPGSARKISLYRYQPSSLLEMVS